MAADLEQLEDDQELEQFFPKRSNNLRFCRLHFYHRRNLVICAKNKISSNRPKSTFLRWFRSIEDKIENSKKLKAKIYFDDLDADLAKKMIKLMEKFNFSVQKDELSNIEENYKGKIFFNGLLFSN